MLTWIYKTKNKDGMYLYLAEKEGFSCLPEELVTQFGKGIFVMVVNLAQRQLALCDNYTVEKALTEQGYYLQLPQNLDHIEQMICAQSTKEPHEKP